MILGDDDKYVIEEQKVESLSKKRSLNMMKKLSSVENKEKVMHLKQFFHPRIDPIANFEKILDIKPKSEMAQIACGTLANYLRE